MYIKRLQVHCAQLWRLQDICTCLIKDTSPLNGFASLSTNMGQCPPPTRCFFISCPHPTLSLELLAGCSIADSTENFISVIFNNCRSLELSEYRCKYYAEYFLMHYIAPHNVVEIHFLGHSTVFSFKIYIL